MKTAECRGCGKPIVWVYLMKRNAAGDLEPCGSAPMDPRAPVYRVEEVNGEMVAFRANGPMAPTSDEGGMYMVTHFSTCPKASEFTRGGKKPARRG